jgi:hypothetical protein
MLEGSTADVAGAHAVVRRLGMLTETIHAVVYFAPEAQEAYARLGLKGYWRGYFASRTAALGPVGAEVAAAVLGGFAPSFVERAVPAVWEIAAPGAVLEARRTAAALALRRLLPGRSGEAAAAAELTGRVVRSLDTAGRPLAAAHRAAPRPDEPFAALWHDCTVLREHRGDGHLAAVTSSGLRWPVPHVLAAARVDARQQELRGWSDDAWSLATEQAAGLPPDTAERLEAATDAAAAPAYAAVDRRRLETVLTGLAERVQVSGGMPFPNAMGLPRLSLD